MGIHGSITRWLEQPNHLTGSGIASLGGLTNLTILRFFYTGKLSSGVLEQVCTLKHLRVLSLMASLPPKGEYVCLKNLQSLSELHLLCCTNFGDQELKQLSNLTNLSSLELKYDGFSEQGTNVLRQMHNLTNVWVRPVANPKGS